MMNWTEIGRRAAAGDALTRGQALAVLHSGDDELLAVLDAAFRVRLAFWDRGVNLHVLRNAKSGMCRENCAFCSQAIGAYSGVDRYQDAVGGEPGGRGPGRPSGRGGEVLHGHRDPRPSPSDLELTVCEAVRQIKARRGHQICASLGLLTRDQAEQLKAAGVDRFNHNLETSSRYYPEVCQTHTWEERVDTIRHVKEVGMEACCGGIMGMGETPEDRVDLAFALRELEVESIPVNFLDPRPGTPLGDVERLRRADCLRALCMFRFVNPTRDIRAAGGREVCLAACSPWPCIPRTPCSPRATSPPAARATDADLQMIEDAGFFVRDIHHEGSDQPASETASVS